MSDEDFPILLEYMEGLTGTGRKTTAEKAENLLKSHESAVSEASNDKSEEDDNKPTEQSSDKG